MADQRQPTTATHVIWISGGGCDGCTMAMLGASEPGLENLLAAGIGDIPPFKLIHPLLAVESGDDYLGHLRKAARGQIPVFVLVLEGPVLNESLARGGSFSRLGSKGDTPVTISEWLTELAPRAQAVIAIGSCATDGGMPAAAGSPTGAMGLSDYLGRDFTSAAGLPVVNMPGCSHVRDNRGRTSGVLIVAHDISDTKRIERERQELLEREKKARAEAEAANRAKDEFLAMVSHELRTPLTAIIGWACLLRSRDLDDARRMRALETIERGAKSQAQLVEDLLDISRIMSGRLRLETSVIDLRTAAIAAIDTIRPAAEAKGIALKYEFNDSPSPVLADFERIQQVIWNSTLQKAKARENVDFSGIQEPGADGFF